MKVKLNPAFEGMSGTLGEIVFREVRGRTVVSRKPDTANDQPTVGQVAHRERFKLAAAYGKSVMADAALRPLYEEAARRKNVPVFSVTVADYFNAPVIGEIDLSQYTGARDSVITVPATDDFGVQSMQVIISDDQGNHIESGAAQETAQGSGRWVYIAQSSPVASTLVVKAIATDRPSGTAVKSKTLTR